MFSIVLHLSRSDVPSLALFSISGPDLGCGQFVVFVEFLYKGSGSNNHVLKQQLVSRMRLCSVVVLPKTVSKRWQREGLRGDPTVWPCPQV